MNPVGYSLKQKEEFLRKLGAELKQMKEDGLENTEEYGMKEWEFDLMIEHYDCHLAADNEVNPPC